MTAFPGGYVLKDTIEDYLTLTVPPNLKVFAPLNIETVGRAHDSNIVAQFEKEFVVFTATKEVSRP
jgi:hypothetical protein